jgi:hypothetical protein
MIRMIPPGLLPRGQTAETGEGLGTLPDVLLHLLVEEFHVLPTGGLGDPARAEVVEAGRRTNGHAHPALVAAVEIVGKADVGLNLAEQVLFDLEGDIVEPCHLRRLIQGAQSGWDGGCRRHGGGHHQSTPLRL